MRYIGGSKGGGTRDATPPPLGPIYFILYSFQEKFSQIIGWCPHLGVGTPLPSGKSWICHWDILVISLFFLKYGNLQTSSEFSLCYYPLKHKYGNWIFSSKSTQSLTFSVETTSHEFRFRTVTRARTMLRPETLNHSSALQCSRTLNHTLLYDRW